MIKPRYYAEALIVVLLYALCRALPLDAASWLGGKTARLLGPCFRRLSRVAYTNLQLAFPNMSQEERARIVASMWENLGRNAAEIAHLKGSALLKRTTFKGLEHLPAPNQPALFVSGHFGQWELTYASATAHGVRVAAAYRHANNPFVERWLTALRSHHAAHLFPKGGSGSMAMLSALRSGESLALLIDQKMNEGIAIPFFGHDAMTAPAVAKLALRLNLPIIPARVVRTGGAHFQVTAFPPLAITRTGDEETDIRAILTTLHTMLEAWIREHPAQWFWIHRRWGKERYAP